MQLPIYMDGHATIRVDPRVVEAILPFFEESYGNAGTTTGPCHPSGAVR